MPCDSSSKRPQLLVVRRSGRQVLVVEDRPDLLARDLAALGIGLGLHDAGELDLQPAGQVERVVGLEQVGDPPLPDCELTRMTASYERPRSLGSIGRYGTAHSSSSTETPDARPGVHRLEALLDRVLVRAAEGREDEVAGPGAALVHGQLVAVLGGALDLVDVAEVDLRVDALGQQVDPECDEVDVAGALPVAEEASLDAVGAGHVAELGGRDRGAAVVVRVQREETFSRWARWRLIHSIESA